MKYCAEHPDAPVRHSWNRTQYVMNGLPSGSAVDSDHLYQCSECGQRLDVDGRDLIPILTVNLGLSYDELSEKVAIVTA